MRPRGSARALVVVAVLAITTLVLAVGTASGSNGGWCGTDGRVGADGPRNGDGDGPAVALDGPAGTVFAEDIVLDVAIRSGEHDEDEDRSASRDDDEEEQELPASAVILRSSTTDPTPVPIGSVDLTVAGWDRCRSAVGTFVDTDDLPADTYTYTAVTGGAVPEAVAGHDRVPGDGQASATHRVVVGRAGTAVRLAAAPTVVPDGGEATLRATVSRAAAGAGPTPTGEVVLTRDGAPVGTLVLVDGEAALVVGDLSGGEVVFAASYLGAPGTYAPAGPSSTTVSVLPPPPPPTTTTTTTTTEPATTTTTATVPAATTTTTTAPPVPVATITGEAPPPPPPVPTSTPPADAGPAVVLDEEVAAAIVPLLPPTTVGARPLGPDLQAQAAPGPDAPGAPAAAAGSSGAERSGFVDAIPAPDDVSWTIAHMAANLILALLLIIMVGLPAELINSTLKEHYDEVNKPFVGIRAMLAGLEARLMAVPNAVLLVGFGAVGALISSQLDPAFGLNATSAVLFGALTLAFMVITLVLELARIPYIHRRRGARYRHHLRLFPLALVMAAVFVVISRMADFRPGWVFGITCGLVLADEVGDEDHASSLAVAGVLLLVTSLAAWLLWIPWASAAQGADPTLTVLFVDAFLATLWISCLQTVVFGFAPLEALYGKALQRWSFPVWAGIYITAMFFLVQLLLHPSAGRWGGIPTTTFLQMLTLFVVFLVGAGLFWAWYRLKPSKGQGATPSDQTVDAAA